jgi:hypothetical protein
MTPCYAAWTRVSVLSVPILVTVHALTMLPLAVLIKPYKIDEVMTRINDRVAQARSEGR